VNHAELRRRAVAYAVFAALAGTGWWSVTRGMPAYRELGALASHRDALEARTRQAREQAVRSGTAALEDSIAAARARQEALRELVPGVGAGESDGDVRRLVGALAEQSRVAVRSTDDALTERQGPLLVSSVRISAEGTYHDLGRWLASVASTRRLVQVRDVAMATATPAAGGPAPAGANDARGDVVVLTATFRWFRQDTTATPPNSETETR
jgi:Tfp pilus assembly protein PilO